MFVCVVIVKKMIAAAAPVVEVVTVIMKMIYDNDNDSTMAAEVVCDRYVHISFRVYKNRKVFIIIVVHLVF